MFKRALLVLLVIIAAECIHGVLRVLVLAPLVGDFRARQVAVFTGIAIILAITYFFIDWIGARAVKHFLLIGVMWVVLMLGFEFGLGLAQGFTPNRMLEDYDITRGGLLAFGMLGLFLAPLLAAKMRKIPS